MSSPIFIGVDPGIKGAIAFYRPHDHMLAVYPMPTREKKSGRNEIDASELATTVKRFAPFTQIAVVEDVGAGTYRDASGVKRGQGASQSFAFGKSAGIVLGILAAHGVEVVMVAPAVWKQLLGLTRDKDLSRARAIAAFPKSADEFSRKKDNDKAEAALLAFFAADRFKEHKSD